MSEEEGSGVTQDSYHGIKIEETKDASEPNDPVITNPCLNKEDTTRLQDFLQSSLHLNSVLSGNSEYVQDKQLNESSDSDQSDSEFSSNEDDIQCEICQKQFLDEEDLELHVKERRLESKRYRCCSCQKTFRDNTQLKVHARKHTGEKPFQCTICQKYFTVKGNLNKHMRIHTGEKRYECNQCEKKFTQFAHLDDHLKTHSGERPFVCGYCQTGFKTKARLKKHERSHMEGPPTKKSVACPTCNIILKSNRQLSAHLETHIQNTGGPLACGLCGKSFEHYVSLQEHRRTHLDCKSYFCEFCDKKFACGSHLRRHMNSHSGFKPYSCTVCKRPFPSSQNLKRHMMTHTGEKPYDCEECGRKFHTVENLNRHKRTHTGEKPFACEICGRVFAHSTTAKEHYLAIHSIEKPYSCEICNSKFAISKLLYKHVRQRHPQEYEQFKIEQDMTPNMKKALRKYRNVGLKTEKGSVRIEGTDGKLAIRRIDEPLVKMEPITNAYIKDEPNESNDSGYTTLNLSTIVKKEPSSDDCVVNQDFESAEFSEKNEYEKPPKKRKLDMYIKEEQEVGIY
ncbi:zinc finger protein 883-like [Anthonomus grandis grandis]|uniref:zinc finger protein 883-like n=1 Tax=Anthonomus grandis grandis TaxID=2921223 RepID=UPI002164F253|nr:zinc finger protein 883-like [Anthonomus grandis grandis]